MASRMAISSPLQEVDGFGNSSCSINGFEQFFDRWPVRRVLAPMCEEDVACTIDQEVAPCLIVIIFAIVLEFLAFTQ